LTRCCLRLRFCSNEGNEIVVPPITPIAPYPITPQNKILLLHYVPRDGDGAPGSIGQTVTDVAPYPLCTTATATATAALLFVIISITSRMMRIQFLVPPQRLVINTGLWFACRKYCFIFATDTKVEKGFQRVTHVQRTAPSIGNGGNANIGMRVTNLLQGANGIVKQVLSLRPRRGVRPTMR
jgi:hypothetical protein